MSLTQVNNGLPTAFSSLAALTLSAAPAMGQGIWETVTSMFRATLTPEQLKLNQDRVDVWCEAYFFDAAKELTRGFSADEAEVDGSILARLAAGKLNELCIGADPYIWSNKSDLKLESPKKNIFPNLFESGLRDHRLSHVLALAHAKLITLDPKVKTNYSVLHQAMDVDVTRHLVDLGHNIDSLNADGKTLLTVAVQNRRLLKEKIFDLIDLIEKLGGDFSLKGSGKAAISPLAAALSDYANTKKPNMDEENEKLQELVNYLSAGDAKIQADEFYKLSYTGLSLKEVSIQDNMLLAFRRFIRLNPYLLKSLIERGLDVTAKVPEGNFVAPSGRRLDKNRIMNTPFALTLIQQLGYNDYDFSKTDKPSKQQTKIMDNTVKCLQMIVEEFSEDELRELKDAQGNSLVDFVKRVDFTPDKIITNFFEKHFQDELKSKTEV